MAIKLVRIDDRLIHGQIAAVWSKSLNINRIWIVDNKTAQDDFLQSVMKMVSPPDVELVITSTNEIKECVDKYDNAKDATLVLVKYPWVAKMLFDAGVKNKALNVGGMQATPERKLLYQNLSASDEERQTLHEMQESGIDVYFQVTPDVKKIPFSK